MKLTLRIALPALICLPAMAFSQSLPNGDMEIWEPLLLGSGEKPTGWDTPDVIASALGISDRVVEKESGDVESGSFAARLTTKDLTAPPPIGTLTVPGVLALGTIIFDPLTLEVDVVGGLAMSERPEGLVGYYSYAPATGDTMSISVVAFKEGAQIGGGVFQSSVASSGYEAFTLPIAYATADVPDTIRVVILSSSGFGSAVAGSSLLVDNMMFTGISSVDGLAAAGIKTTLYPNPTSDFLNVENPKDVTLTAEVFNINGTKVAEELLPSGLNQIAVGNYPAGMYMVRISENGQFLYSGKFRVVN